MTVAIQFALGLQVVKPFKSSKYIFQKMNIILFCSINFLFLSMRKSNIEMGKTEGLLHSALS